MFSAAFSPAFARVSLQDAAERSLAAEMQSLAPSALIILFELDLTPIGEADLFRFHAGVNEKMAPVVWRGEEYLPMPIKASGYETNSQGTLPRPKVQIANADGIMSALVLSYDDLIGCRLTRRRTYARYLDAVNFVEGNPQADPEVEFPPDTFYVNRLLSDVPEELTEFELAPLTEVQGIKAPRRQVIGDTCSFRYRDPDTCQYAGAAMFDTDNNPTTNPVLDRCNHKTSGCLIRHPDQSLPFGNFPGASLIRA